MAPGMPRFAAVLGIAFCSLAVGEEPSRLLFARAAGTHCDVGVWDSDTSNTIELTTIDECPEDLYVDDESVVYVVDDDVLLLVPIDGSGAIDQVPLPDLSWRAWVDQMEVRPDQYAGYLPSIDEMKPLLAGRLADGSLGFAASLWMPADDEYHYIYRYDGDEWAIVGYRHCGRFGCEDPLEALESRSTNLWAWPEDRRVWNERLVDNPHVTSRHVDTENSVHSLTIDIDGASSTLRAYVGPSAHFDLVYTFGIDFRMGDGPFVSLSDKQCMTSVVGRHILVREFFGGRFEVTDLGTGKTLISDLKAAMWLD